MVKLVCMCVFAALLPQVSRSRQAAIATDWPSKRPEGLAIDFSVKKRLKTFDCLLELWKSL